MGHLQKEGLRPNPEAPKTILERNSSYKLRTNTTELQKLRTFKVRTPTLLHLMRLGRKILLLYMILHLIYLQIPVMIPYL